jgi:DNA-binding PadR family transcriptional regulator
MAPSPPNATAASLLGFLHHGPMSGWDLAAVAETVIGDFWSLTRSQVYRELDRMEADGLVEAGEPEARNRRPYAITEAGEAAFAAWIDEEPGPEHIRFPLLLTVAFGGHLSPGRLRAFVAAHRAVHAERLSDYERQHEEATAPGVDPDPFALATLEFGLLYERAVMAWFDRLPDRLPGSSEG